MMEKHLEIVFSFNSGGGGKKNDKNLIFFHLSTLKMFAWGPQQQFSSEKLPKYLRNTIVEGGGKCVPIKGEQGTKIHQKIQKWLF